jgi:3-deoxy-manno-octulosonate cytidylyltransferase (CMP-KDO synthetase)
MASQRLPGKPLLHETGKYLIQHVYERVRLARRVRDVILATDDPGIVRAAESFGARAVLTASTHLSGTDRIAEVAAALQEDIVLNVQGDEPEIEPTAIDQLVDLMAGSADVRMGTLAYPITSRDEYLNPNVVKVVVDRIGDALYFSRSPIPAHRAGEESFDRWPVPPLHHMGVYGFRRDFLLTFVSLTPGRLEKLERLEQLRALEHGYRIRVGMRPSGHAGIDTPEEYRAFVQRWNQGSGRGDREPR